MHRFSDQTVRKYTDVVELDEWSIHTDSGWQLLDDVKQTVEYQVYELELANGMVLKCADDHIVFDEHMHEVYVKDLAIGQEIQTARGLSQVVQLNITSEYENMYDVGVAHSDHRFYSNGILSHNSTCAAGYLLWFAMFKPDSTILIAAHKYTGSQEIMQRVRFMYENLPEWIKAGAVSYNKGSIDFDNGSRIVSATTTENTGRGMSITLVYCLDGDTSFVRIRNKHTLVEEEISLKDLYIRLLGPLKVLT